MHLVTRMLLQILLIISVTVSIVSSENGSRNEMISDEDSFSVKQNISKMVAHKESELFADRSFDAGNLSNALSALVNSTFIFKALLIYWFHVKLLRSEIVLNIFFPALVPNSWLVPHISSLEYWKGRRG